MPRTPRVDAGDIVYHILNRATARIEIFRKDGDYNAFETVLQEAKEKYPMRILGYCLMPNHWHMVLHPEQDEQVRSFMQWVTMTHTQRWHAAHDTVGSGHLYQGRYKSFPVQTDEHFVQLIRYVERNAKRAELVDRAEDWRWSSLHKRLYGTAKQKLILAQWPIEEPPNYVEWVNTPQPKEELETIRLSVEKGRPYGQSMWQQTVTDRLGLQSTWRGRGRPRMQN